MSATVQIRETRLTQASAVCPRIAPHAMMESIRSDLRARPLSKAIARVAAIAADPSSSIGDVADAIGLDPLLAIRIMRVANSAAYARSYRIESVKAAVQRVGVEQAFRLALNAGMEAHFCSSVRGPLDYRRFWEHSRATALLAVEIARVSGLHATAECFLSGLLHDVGRLVLLEHAPLAYGTALELSRELRVRAESVERQLFGMTHCDVGRIALEQWHFPPSCIASAADHHDLHIDGSRGKTSAVIVLADRLAHASLLGSSGNEMLGPIAGLVRFLGLTDASLRAILDRVLSEMADVRQTLGSDFDDFELDDMVVEYQRDHRLTNALVVADSDGLSSLEIALRRLKDSAVSAPNVGILAVERPEMLVATFARFLEREAAEAQGVLPLAIATAAPDSAIECLKVNHRVLRKLPWPLHIEELMTCLDQLVAAASGR